MTVDGLSKNALGAAVGIGAVGLAVHSMKMIPKMNMGMKMKHGKGQQQRMRMRTSSKPLVKGAVDLMVGTALLGGAASAINNI